MVESTARRERTEVKSSPLATYLWEVPQKPVAVRVAFDLIDRMEHEVIENFRSLTSRGSEIGGVLLGSMVTGSPLSVVVKDYETIPCDYSRGPLYRLSDADLGRFERAIEQHNAPGMIVTGFFRAHSRKGLSLDAEDLAFLDARFREPHHIALLVRPFATKTSVGGLFIREEGAFRGEASYLEFPFRSSQLTPSLWTPPEAAPPPPSQASAPVSAPPAAKPGMRPQVVPIGLRRDGGAATPSVEAKSTVPPLADKKPAESKPPAAPAKPPAAEVKTAAPARPAVPESKPAAKEVKPPAAVVKDAPRAKEAEAARPVKPAEKPMSGILSGVPAESQGSGKLMMVLGGVAATVAILVLLFVYPGFLTHSRHSAAVESPAAELTLRVEPSGTDLLLTWNKNSAAIANATHGVLSIHDGDKNENYDMDPTQLTTGSIIYTPVSGDVSFRMEVTGKNQTKTLTESVRSLRTRPSPMPDSKSPAPSTTAAKSNQTQQPAASPATSPSAANPPAISPTAAAPEEVTPPVPVKAAPKAFNAASLTQRLRPASPTEIADANLAGAAPASQAGVNVNPNLSMFASAPAPVSPTPAPAPAARKTVPAAGGKVAPAQLVYRKEPEYPTMARQMNAKGQVVLEATIGPDGRVTSVKVISGHPLLVQAARQAVMQWRYKPTLLDGQPVENTSQISLNFVGTH
jgi:protein TonB